MKLKKPSGWTEIAGHCDDDYCTGCEPGCTLETLVFEGPMERQHYEFGPLERMLAEAYSSTDLSDMCAGLPNTDKPAKLSP